jgi:hypothetical protein
VYCTVVRLAIESIRAERARVRRTTDIAHGLKWCKRRIGVSVLGRESVHPLFTSKEKGAAGVFKYAGQVTGAVEANEKKGLETWRVGKSFAFF